MQYSQKVINIFFSVNNTLRYGHVMHILQRSESIKDLNSYLERVGTNSISGFSKGWWGEISSYFLLKLKWI